MCVYIYIYMGVSKNRSTTKLSILIGFSIMFTIHFGGKTPIFGNIHIFIERERERERDISESVQISPPFHGFMCAFENFPRFRARFSRSYLRLPFIMPGMFHLSQENPAILSMKYLLVKNGIQK